MYSPFYIQSEEKERRQEGNPDPQASNLCNVTGNRSLLSLLSGAVFGDPNGSSRTKVVVSSVTQAQLLAAKRTNDTAERLASALLTLLFEPKELARGNCTKPVSRYSSA